MKEIIKVNYKTIKNIIWKTVKYNYCWVEFIWEIRIAFDWYFKKEITLKIDTRNWVKTLWDVRLFIDSKDKEDYIEFNLITN